MSQDGGENTVDMPPGNQILTDDARWALVTGASAGIGQEFCKQLAAQGYHLVMVARRADRMHALASELRTQYSTASLVIPADLSRPGASREIVSKLEQEDIFVEFLVNNAGYGVPRQYTDVNWSIHCDFMQVLVMAVCELTWLLLPEMKKRDRGRIINVSSAAALLPASGGHTLYAASKAFLVKFSESLALENEQYGIRVSALCPGFTYTEFHDVIDTRKLVSKLPPWLWLQADDVVAYGIEAVNGPSHRTIAVPGKIYRFMVWLSGAMPWLGRLLTRRNAHKFRDMGQQ